MSRLPRIARPPVVWAAIALLGAGALLMIPMGALAVTIAVFLLMLAGLVAAGVRGARAVVWFLTAAAVGTEIARLLSFPSLQTLQDAYASVFAGGRGWVLVCFWLGELCLVAAAVLLAFPSARPFFEPQRVLPPSIQDRL